MADGNVVQIIGTVLDVEFPSDALPALFNAVTVRAADGREIVAEVQQHLGNNRVRCLAMDAMEGVARGAVVTDTDRAIAVPVGDIALGRLFNVLGQPLDDLGAIPPRHRDLAHPPQSAHL